MTQKVHSHPNISKKVFPRTTTNPTTRLSRCAADKKGLRKNQHQIFCQKATSNLKIKIQYFSICNSQPLELYWVHKGATQSQEIWHVHCTHLIDQFQWYNALRWAEIWLNPLLCRYYVCENVSKSKRCVSKLAPPIAEGLVGRPEICTNIDPQRNFLMSWEVPKLFLKY